MNNIESMPTRGQGSEVLPAKSLEEFLKSCPPNKTITECVVKTWNKINDTKYQKILCSISGGADSDVMLDLLFRCDKDKKIDYVWFDTGLEYQATKEHLSYLEEKYGIELIRYKALKPIPLCCEQYGQPFLNKRVSRFIEDLQRHDFSWEDESFEELSSKYDHCVAALKWWCNILSNGTNGSYNISNNKWLKEFLIENPPQFKISPKCCDYAKKKVAHKLIKDNHYGLDCTGVRKFEFGVRSSIYKSCFSENEKGADNFMPLFWFTDQDKQDYEENFGVSHSMAYTEYGLKRTGCVGCPYNRKFEDELIVVEKNEPKLYNAINNIFKESYDYTRKYKEFAGKMNGKIEEEK